MAAILASPPTTSGARTLGMAQQAGAAHRREASTSREPVRLPGHRPARTQRVWVGRGWLARGPAQAGGRAAGGRLAARRLGSAPAARPGQASSCRAAVVVAGRSSGTWARQCVVRWWPPPSPVSMAPVRQRSTRTYGWRFTGGPAQTSPRRVGPAGAGPTASTACDAGRCPGLGRLRARRDDDRGSGRLTALRPPRRANERRWTAAGCHRCRRLTGDLGARASVWLCAGVRFQS